MKNIYTALSTLVLFVVLALPGQSFAATTYYSTNDTLAARIAALTAEIERLKADIRASQGYTNYGSNLCYNAYGVSSYCTPSYSTSNVARVEADIYNDYTRVEIEYTNGRSKDLVFNADSESEVIDYLMDETGASRAHLISVTRFDNSSYDDYDDDDNYSNNDDLERIIATIGSRDTRVEVRYEDNDTERFTLRNERNRDDIIEKIADEINEDEDDVEDIIRFDSDNDNDYRDDVDSIEVTIDRSDDDAIARIEYDNGSRETFSYSTDDEDYIIEHLADELDMDEDDVEDLIEFDYE
ncbi:DUF1192 domain-containing protein [Patescibacteria group bacterium]|nr:DUF1192 domain-containing protein [Patescibacteria group bacterium]